MLSTEVPLRPVWETPAFERLMVFAVMGVAALGALFVVLILVRYWMQRSAKRSGPGGALDLEHLRRERDAGRITENEYEAIRNRMAGTGAPAARGEGGRPSGPISEKGASDGADAGSEGHGTR
ncbi:MAG TPA: hypothetical protein VMY35_18495 [Phycisphaerae bacterium]|nr:hypothetical protein [Phycisphaerae bacterium]